jgi:hypothetical protein
MFLVRISIIDRDAWLSLSRLSVGSAYFLRSSIDVASPSFDQLFCGGSDFRWMNLLIALNVQIDNSIVLRDSKDLQIARYQNIEDSICS